MLLPSCHCTLRSLRSFRPRCPRAMKSSPRSNRRWRRWSVCVVVRWRKHVHCPRLISGETECFPFCLQMTKKIKKLEKETAMYRSRWESSNKALLEMSEEVTWISCWLEASWPVYSQFVCKRHIFLSFVCLSCLQKAVRDREFEALQGKVQRLEKLRRALKVERNELNKKVQNLNGQQSGASGAPTSEPVADSPSPPPTDSLLEASLDPSSLSIPDATSCSHTCPCDPELDTDTLLEAHSQPTAAQEWGYSQKTTLLTVSSFPSSITPPACEPLLLHWRKLMFNTADSHSFMYVIDLPAVNGRVNPRLPLLGDGMTVPHPSVHFHAHCNWITVNNLCTVKVAFKHLRQLHPIIWLSWFT